MAKYLSGRPRQCAAPPLTRLASVHRCAIRSAFGSGVGEERLIAQVACFSEIVRPAGWSAPDRGRQHDGIAGTLTIATVCLLRAEMIGISLGELRIIEQRLLVLLDEAVEIAADAAHRFLPTPPRHCCVVDVGRVHHAMII